MWACVQAEIQDSQPMHCSPMIRTIPSFLSFTIASVGHAAIHLGSLHWKQAIALKGLFCEYFVI